MVAGNTVEYLKFQSDIANIFSSLETYIRKLPTQILKHSKQIT